VLPPPPQGRLMLERAPAARALQGGTNVLFNISLRLSMQPTDLSVIAYGGPGAALAAVMAVLVATTAPGNQLLFPNTNAAWSTANLVQNVFGISPMVVAQAVPFVAGTFSLSPTPSQSAAASSTPSSVPAGAQGSQILSMAVTGGGTLSSTWTNVVGGNPSPACNYGIIDGIGTNAMFPSHLDYCADASFSNFYVTDYSVSRFAAVEVDGERHTSLQFPFLLSLSLSPVSVSTTSVQSLFYHIYRTTSSAK